MKNVLKIVLVLLMYTSCKPRPQIQLQYKLKQDDTYSYRTEIEQDWQYLSQTIDDTTKEKSSLKKVMEATSTISKLTDNGFNAKLKMSSLLVEEEGIHIYNSNAGNKEIPREAKAYDELFNNEFKISFDKQGVIEELTGADSLMNKLIKMESSYDDDELTEEEKIRIAKFILEKYYEKDAIINDLQQNMVIYPKDSLYIGYQWVNEYYSKKLYPIQLTSTYTMTNYDEDYVYLDILSTIKSSQDEVFMIEYTNRILSLEGTRSGSIIVDRHTGVLYHSKYEDRIEVVSDIVIRFGAIYGKQSVSFISKVETQRLE